MRHSLYSLLAAEEFREKEYAEQLREQRDLREWIHELSLAVEDAGKKIEDSEKKELYKYKTDSRLAEVFTLKNSFYVKTLFQNDSRLMKWIQRSQEMLFFAIQFGNLDLVRFFVEKGKMINAAREFTHFSPLHVAIIAGRLSIIRFFLNHPETNLRQKSVWGDNLFHVVFFSGPQGDKGPKKTREKKVNRSQILQMLCQRKYFSRISDLLNTPNDHNETVLDFAKRDQMDRKREVIELLRRKKALLFTELPKDKIASLERRNAQKIYDYSACPAQFLSSSLEFQGVSLE